MKPILFSFIFTFLIQTGYSCSCVRLPVLFNYNESMQVFKGKVLDIIVHEESFLKTIKFQILKTYKGKLKSDTVDITTKRSQGVCGLFVNRNETWLIFADRLYTGHCHGNILLDGEESRVRFYGAEAKSAIRLLDSVTTLPAHYMKIYEEGKVIMEGKWAMGHPQGYWKYYCLTYTPGGYEAYYKNGIKDSVAYSYYEDKKIEMEERYKNGLMHGRFVYYHSHGGIYKTGVYLNGQMHGEFNTYYESGRLEEREVYDHEKTIQYLRFFESGDTNKYRLYESGECMVDKLWGNEGKLLSQSINVFKGDTLFHIYEEYYPNGNRKGKGQSYNGKTHGELQEFYEDGTIKAKRYFEHDKEVGTWYYYDTNGILYKTESH